MESEYTHIRSYDYITCGLCRLYARCYATQWPEGQFSQAQDYSLRQPCRTNFTEIGTIVSQLNKVEKKMQRNPYTSMHNN